MRWDEPETNTTQHKQTNKKKAMNKLWACEIEGDRPMDGMGRCNNKPQPQKFAIFFSVSSTTLW